MWWSKYIKTNIPLGTKEKLILLAVVSGISLLLIIQFYFLPAVANMKNFAQAIPKRQEDLKELLKLRDEFFELRNKMASINGAIQKRGPHFELLTFLEELAKKCNIDNKIVSMRPLNHPSLLPNEMTVEIDIDGLVTEELTRYLYEIENSGKLLYIKKTNIRSNFGPEKHLNVSLHVSTLTEKI
ncbi:MAG: hypothetical protein ACMUIA_09820 [bacterium]